MVASASWTCPSCARRVPPRVGVCRCGTRLSDGVPADAVAVAAPVGSGAPVGRTWLALTVLGLALGAWAWTRPEPAVAPAPSVLTRAEASAAPATAGAATAAEAAPVSPVADAPVLPRREPGPESRAEPAPPPTTAAGNAALEDVVARALGAVVMVEAAQSRGTGFFVTPDVVVTNDHVVGRESSVTIRLHGGGTRSARVERTVPDVDLAVLRVWGGGAVQVLALGSGEAARVGQEVIAIGSALGLQSTVTRGIVSAKRRSGAVALLQTDAAINPGNSGGPLLDREGIVLGVTTLKAGGNAEGVGFAVAAEHVRALVDGRSPVAAVAAAAPSPAGQAPMPMPAMGPTADSVRAANLAALERQMRTLADQAAQVDAQWERFAGLCRPRGARDGDRAWFALAAAAPAFDGTDANCAYFVRDLQRAAVVFAEAMRATAESTRRAGLLPGDLRSLRRQYRLDWTGFDR